jgi:DNA repair protein RadD
MAQLRPYQSNVIDEFERIPKGSKTLLVAPTGAGKTVVAAEIIRRQVEQYRSVLFLAHRREIIAQTSRKLFANGVSPDLNSKLGFVCAST